jgi:hypothetical protein
VIGAPEDEAGALDLWKRDPFQFEAWAVTRLLGIKPNERKVGDKGIDGLGRFYLGRSSDGRERYGRIYVSVKGGQNIGPSMVRDFRGAMERERADLGVFICQRKPTRDMISEAASAGQYREIEGRDIPRIQFYTIADYFARRRPNLPPTIDEGRRRAREGRPTGSTDLTVPDSARTTRSSPLPRRVRLCRSNPPQLLIKRGFVLIAAQFACGFDEPLVLLLIGLGYLAGHSLSSARNAHRGLAALTKRNL